MYHALRALTLFTVLSFFTPHSLANSEDCLSSSLAVHRLTACIPPGELLARSLENATGSTRFRLLTQVCRLGIQAKETIPTLCQVLLYDRSWPCRQLAAAAMAEMGPDAAEALPAILEAFHDSEIGVRAMATYASVRIGPDSIPYLKKAWAHPDPRVRNCVRQALSYFVSVPAENR